jgi:diguanylate cyclase (GGDEF)-like protein/PAS domain S-box-containing protein
MALHKTGAVALATACFAAALVLTVLLWADPAASTLARLLATLLLPGTLAFALLAQRRLRAAEAGYATQRTAHDRMAALVDSIPEGAFMTDLDGRISAINQTSAASMQHTPQSALGKIIDDMVAPGEGARLKAIRRQVLDSGKMARVEQAALIHGRTRWYDVIYVPVRGPAGDTVHIAGMSRDVTRRREAEQREREASAELQATVRELERVNANIRMLAQMMDALQACSTVDESFDVFRKYCTRLLPDVAGAVYLLRSSRDLLEPVAPFGVCTQAPELMPPEDCLGMRRGRVHAVADPAEDLVCAHWRSQGPAGPSLCLPLVAQGDMIGLLAFRSAGGAPITDATQQLAHSMAEQIALSLSGLRLREQLRRQSIVDALTGLYNRRFLDESLLRELARASRKSQPLSLLMLDLDHFKKWNDERGHDAGDQVLRLVGSELQRSIRGSDIACRFGGEEFAILMPETGATVALQRANAIRERLGRIDIEYSGQVAGRISVSIGVACFPQHGGDANALVRAADAALYEAKGAGRDRVMLSGHGLEKITA